MSQPAEKADQARLIQEIRSAGPSEGPAASPPAPLHATAGETRGRRSRRSVGGEQLALPLYPARESEAGEAAPGAASQVKPKRGRRRKGGFVPVTRDPDVARSYSEHAALDNAMAEGLARALATLPPEELAELRAKLSRPREES